MRSAAQVKGRDRIALTVSERRSGRTISSPFFSMAEPAVHGLKEFCATLHALRRGGWLGRNHHRSSRFLFLKSRRKTLYVCDKINPLLARQGFPRWHASGVNATADRIVQVAIQWQTSTRRRSAFECSLCEIARLGIKIGRAFPPPIAVCTMTEDAVALIESLSSLNIAR